MHHMQTSYIHNRQNQYNHSKTQIALFLLFRPPRLSDSYSLPSIFLLLINRPVPFNKDKIIKHICLEHTVAQLYKLRNSKIWLSLMKSKLKNTLSSNKTYITNFDIRYSLTTYIFIRSFLCCPFVVYMSFANYSAVTNFLQTVEV